MSSLSNVQNLVRIYLAGEIDLRNFADQFEDLYSKLNAEGLSEGLALADKVASFLGRASSGYIEESHLRKSLLPLSYSASGPSNVSVSLPISSGAVIYQHPAAESSQEIGPFGTSPLTVYV